MKKLILIPIAMLVLLLSSCSRMMISDILTPEVMKQRYPELYPMREDECGHLSVFYKTLDGMIVNLPSDKYHYEYCAYLNCEHENGAVPHGGPWRIKISYESYIAEDGNAYHPTIFYCTECGKEVFKLLRCRKGTTKCNEYGNLAYYDRYTMEEWEKIALGNKKLYYEENAGTNE